jgi:dnd system-associated protein 4
MKKVNTITDAALQALNLLEKPSTINEIYASILENELFEFNTPTPEHVLRTTIRRHTGNVVRVDSSAPVLFEMADDEIYGMVSMNTVATRKQSSMGVKRIHRASDKEELVKALSSDQVGLFKEIWKLLLFAAQVGMANQRREPLKSIESGKGIDQSTFGNCPSWPGIVYLLALVENEKSDALLGTSEAEDSRIAIFQEYANGGLSVLMEFFRDRVMDIDGMLAFIESQTIKEVSPLDLELMI